MTKHTMQEYTRILWTALKS